MPNKSVQAITPTVGIPQLFLRWYWQEKPKQILKAYVRYASAFGNVFSLLYLLKTFAAPWKSIRDEYPTKGFNLQMIFETLTLNLTARVVGMVVRSGAMIFGMIIQFFLFVGLCIYMMLWVMLPVWIIAGAVLLLVLLS